ncbi:outer membrane protein assembly factor BamD [Ligilactobacillus salivarius]|uniref:outer membrane protein assembly factor BamD n=1 Tax=Ligilactobacillus salivarius TaxID=1624 RepID=UPI0013711701|nr:outer membrane protein assembly factor BamD [Ligilactobacillus salivarius]MYU57649.1 outer membrane protein assembly factor BamD [Ligilactobacillus salivarius]MYU59788.1 outer membrane protein assembly factor BamD [Ligilactobacillus salivarius]MYU83258.1 outer membrane protein assembly factor BamD [Ligilactobacillus salivarius]MYU85394.1 outer membrane protein assembly factor BamD [Ligilactobacillus salivarius]MYU87120.1 outer membrane protein assembly factor BamD [Ligilactobacillus salivar
MSELYFQAEEAYKNKDYTKARKLLEKEYLEKKTFRTNYFLFLVFLKIEDYIAAYETANEYIRQYIIDNEKFKKYQKAAIFAGMNVKLQELSNNIFEYTTESEQKEFDKNQQTLLTDYLNKNSKLELMKQLSYLGVFPLFQQRKILKDAYGLSVDDFFINTKKILIDSNIHPLLKSNILDDYRKLNLEETVQYTDYKNTVKILDVRKLKEIEECKIYKKIYKEFKQLPMNDFEKNLKWKEIVLKLMVLYPFNDIEQDLEQNLIYILLCNDEFKVLNEQELAFSKKLEDYIEQWNNL